MTGAELLWLVMGMGLVAYVLTGGADYGGGAWHFLSRDDRHRRAVEEAIAPIWEANHVWLIFVIVIMFTAFPRGFAVLGIALHIPITLALIGMVLRGSAFVFNAYGVGKRQTRVWATAFGLSSIATPILLGVVAAGVSSGAIRWDGDRVTTGFFAGWLTLHAWVTGLFALALFMLLAAVYLTVDTDGALREAFRRRAMVMEVVAGLLAFLVLATAWADAPALTHRLLRSSIALPVQGLTAAAAIFTLLGLYLRRFRAARLFAAAQVGLVVIGWGLTMDGAIVFPDVRLENAGAQGPIVGALLPALALGALFIAPSLWYLFRVFKGQRRS